MTETIFALDIRTLAILLAGVGALVAAVFFGLWRQGAGGRPALVWATFYALTATGFLLTALRDVLPVWLSIVVANLTLHIAAFLLLHGACLFVGRPSPIRLSAAVIAAETVALAYWTLLQPDLVARIVLLSAISGGFLMATAVTFMRSRLAGQWGLHLLAAVAFGGMGVVLWLRGIGTLAFPPSSEHFMVSGLLQAGTMALLLLGGMVWALLLLWLIAYSWYADRLEEAAGRERAEAALRRSEARFRTIFESSANGMAFGDEAGRILLANQAFSDLLGYAPSELERFSFMEITHPEDLPHEEERFLELLESLRDHYRLEKRYLAKDGSPIWVDLIVSAVRADDGSPLHFIGVATDIREKRAAQADLEFRATYDRLTGAVNRLAFEQYLETEQNRVERYGEPSGLVMIDIDHFKTINDTHGHQTGDRVLETLAQRVRERLRASDILCRWGGEEFMVLLPETDLAGALQMAESLRQAIERMDFPEVERVTISLGVAQLHAEESFTELAMRVDNALYAAKEGGRNRVEVAQASSTETRFNA